jgi:hypothetical protein
VGNEIATSAEAGMVGWLLAGLRSTGCVRESHSPDALEEIPWPSVLCHCCAGSEVRQDGATASVTGQPPSLSSPDG